MLVCSGLASHPLWLAEEGRDEDAGVEVECGMPPSVREIQHLTSLDSAFKGPCRWCQGRVCVPEPGQCGFVGVEFGCLLRRVQEPALREPGSVPVEGHPRASSCNSKAVSRSCTQQAERRWRIVPKEGGPFGEVVIPKEVQSVCQRKTQDTGISKSPPTHTHGHLSGSPLPMEMGSWGCSICSTYFSKGRSTFW